MQIQSVRTTTRDLVHVIQHLLVECLAEGQKVQQQQLSTKNMHFHSSKVIKTTKS